MGHLSPKGSRQKWFNFVRVKGLHYCKSHNFFFDPTVEERKLYDGKPCIYTDQRFVLGNNNSFGEGLMVYSRKYAFSLKSLIRKVRRAYIPSGTEVEFGTSWYYTAKNVDTRYIFKVRNGRQMPAYDYEINKPKYTSLFSEDVWANELVSALRKNGFIIAVYPNYSHLASMVNAVIRQGQPDIINGEIGGEYAIAHGFGKTIGFSSGSDTLRGYTDGQDNILWDWFGEFDKWSRCKRIPKTTPIDAILEILKVNNK